MNGSGKTAAFSILAFNRVDPSVDKLQVIVFAHTNELCDQIAGVMRALFRDTGIKVVAGIAKEEDIHGHIVVCSPLWMMN